MSFEAYINNIEKLTGKRPADFEMAARAKGLLSGDLTATRFVEWLHEDFALGRGHAMALWTVFKSKGWVAKKSAARTRASAEKSSPKVRR